MIRRHLSLLAILLTASAGVQAQQPAETPPAGKVATVNGAMIPAVYATFVRQARANRNMPQETQTDEAIRDTLINTEVLAQEGVKKGLDKAPMFVAMMAFQRMDMLSQAVLEEYIRNNPVPENVLKENYERAKANTGGIEYHARHILVNDEKLATELLTRLKTDKKVKFEDLAKKHSSDTSASKGGDLGWNIPANYVKEFADGMVNLKKGELSPKPVRSRFGWHIIRMDDRRQISFPPYDKLKVRIAREIQQQALSKYVQELRNAAQVE